MLRFDFVQLILIKTKDKRVIFKSKKGVTIPSQKRYVEYFADFISNNRVYEQIELFLESIKISLNSDLNDFPKSNYLKIFFLVWIGLGEIFIKNLN